MQIGVIGAGNMGKHLARLWSQRGHDVALSAAAVDDKLRAAAAEAHAHPATVAEAASRDVVMLAVWPDALDAVLAAAGDLAGRTVITCVSGLRPDFSGATIGMPTDLTSSIAEQIAQRCPNARVVEAFNTTFAEVLAAPSRSIGGEQPTVLYCGDDAAAKRTAHALIADCGFEPRDAGPLRNARSVETLASVWVQTAVVTKMFPIAGLRILTSPATA